MTGPRRGWKVTRPARRSGSGAPWPAAASAYGEHAAAPADPRGLGRVVHGRRAGGPRGSGHGTGRGPPTTSSPDCCTRPATSGPRPEAVRRCLRAEGVSRAPSQQADHVVSVGEASPADQVVRADQARLGGSWRLRWSMRARRIRRRPRSKPTRQMKCLPRAREPGTAGPLPRRASTRPPAPGTRGQPRSDRSAHPGSRGARAATAPCAERGRRRPRQGAGEGTPAATGRLPVPDRPPPRSPGPAPRGPSTTRTRAAVPGDAASKGALRGSGHPQPEGDG